MPAERGSNTVTQHIIHRIEAIDLDKTPEGAVATFRFVMVCGVIVVSRFVLSNALLEALDQLGKSYEPFLPGQRVEMVSDGKGGGIIWTADYLKGVK